MLTLPLLIVLISQRENGLVYPLSFLQCLSIINEKFYLERHDSTKSKQTKLGSMCDEII